MLVDYSGFRLNTFFGTNLMLILFLIYLQQKNPWAALLQKLVRSKKARYATWEKEEKNCFGDLLVHIIHRTDFTSYDYNVPGLHWKTQSIDREYKYDLHSKKV